MKFYQTNIKDFGLVQEICSGISFKWWKSRKKILKNNHFSSFIPFQYYAPGKHRKLKLENEYSSIRMLFFCDKTDSSLFLCFHWESFVLFSPIYEFLLDNQLLKQSVSLFHPETTDWLFLQLLLTLFRSVHWKHLSSFCHSFSVISCHNHTSNTGKLLQ